MQPQREARLFQQFLDKAVGEYKFAIGSLSISASFLVKTPTLWEQALRRASQGTLWNTSELTESGIGSGTPAAHTRPRSPFRGVKLLEM
jgi:hypothetical protein